MNGITILPDATSLLQTVLAVSVLMALVLVSRRYVAKQFGAGVAYALWALPLARLVLPPLHLPVSLMPRLSLSHGTPANAPADTPTQVIAPVTDQIDPAFTVAPHAPASVHPVSMPDSALDSLLSPQTLMDTLSAMLLPSLLFVWAGGALFFFGLSLWRQHDFMQTVKREAVNVSPRLQHISQQVGRQVGLKRLPVIASSFISSGPLVTGLVRPVVLLPAWFETDYDDTQQRAAIAHELTHVRRGDLWALQAAEFFLACLWFNPLAYLAHRAFRTDQEAACDADVLKTGTASPHAYGATLIKAVKSASQERLPAAAGLPLTHALKERLSRMTHPTPSRSRRLAGGAAATVLGAAALIATSSVSANAEEKTQQREMRIDGGTVYIDGKRIPDRQIVILGKPFEGIEPGPEVHAEIARLSAEMAEEGARIAAITAQITTNTTQVAFSPENDEDFRILMDELNNMPIEIDFSDGINVNIDGDMSAADWEAWGAQFEARAEQWASQVEAHADAIEARADAIEARADAMNEQMEPELERATAEIEARIEAKSAKLESLIEEKFGDDFEARIEATSDAIDDLVEACQDADLAEGETRIMSRTLDLDKGPEEVKIACIKGDEAVLRSDRTLAMIKSDKSLRQADIDSFRDQVGQCDELDGAHD
jgi:beta-lactamase regulating signal transducer with metallopeptidase domain